ncbi:MAG: leucine-rich repeat domain-containing protein [Bacteroidetes bacterium]|nr:leucine-rich repeat domain-containing protein [Bacteroidota bacterium]MBU1580420.1 leucine-rich repeat domain-containing protein [Bacteroidota bacterium]MBU2465215.1 leucine-rich repeat domain-containing protein [Bacteroidota bacterium]MBU2556729.1 leucine-rich repeat domain-containing protein [Bacteroidota bacterium]
MTIVELHNRLIEAYSPVSLNVIATTLLTFYKNKQYSILRKIAAIVSESVRIEIDEDGKGFSRFMMLYHPDRASCHINEINELASKGSYDGLLEYSHILLLSRIDEVAASFVNCEEIDYAPIYEWDFSTEGFTIIDDKATSETFKERKFKEKATVQFYNFYDAVKLRMFGNTKMEYPSYYLEDIDEFELACSDINDLDGIEYCKHVKTLDLSNNHIYDLTPLFGLSLLEELDLSDNTITDIDVLSNLENLKVINLSNNNIDDILPIINLPWLEYVNLSGTRVDKKQVEQLRGLQVTVELDLNNNPSN